MKVVDIERVVILMRFIQYGWDEERKKGFEENLRMMLETQCEDLAEHDKQIKADVLNVIIEYIKEQFPFWRNDLLADVIEKAEQLKEQADEINRCR